MYCQYKEYNATFYIFKILILFRTFFLNHSWEAGSSWIQWIWSTIYVHNHRMRLHNMLIHFIPIYMIPYTLANIENSDIVWIWLPSIPFISLKSPSIPPYSIRRSFQPLTMSELCLNTQQKPNQTYTCYNRMGRLLKPVKLRLMFMPLLWSRFTLTGTLLSMTSRGHYDPTNCQHLIIAIQRFPYFLIMSPYICNQFLQSQNPAKLFNILQIISCYKCQMGWW